MKKYKMYLKVYLGETECRSEWDANSQGWMEWLENPKDLINTHHQYFTSEEVK